jgi:metal-sulfur cluster biosynthetic enzyme
VFLFPIRLGEFDKVIGKLDWIVKIADKNDLGTRFVLVRIRDGKAVHQVRSIRSPLRKQNTPVRTNVAEGWGIHISRFGWLYNVSGFSAVAVKMTLTSPMCPVAGSLPPEVEGKIKKVAGVTAVKVELVWDPPWTPALMSEAAKLQLNMF